MDEQLVSMLVTVVVRLRDSNYKPNNVSAPMAPRFKVVPCAYSFTTLQNWNFVTEIGMVAEPTMTVLQLLNE